MSEPLAVVAARAHAAVGVESRRHLLARLHRRDRHAFRVGQPLGAVPVAAGVAVLLAGDRAGRQSAGVARLAPRHGDGADPGRCVRRVPSSSSSRSARWSVSRSPTCCGNSEKYVNRTVNFLNDNVRHAHQRHAGDRPRSTIRTARCRSSSAASRARSSTCRSPRSACWCKGLSVMLFTFYLVADGPKMRRAICSRLRPDRQRRVLSGWELAIDKTGGYLYSRALLAGLSAFFHWIAVPGHRHPGAGRDGAVGRPRSASSCRSSAPTSPVRCRCCVQFVDSPPKALVVLDLRRRSTSRWRTTSSLPRITARTMDLHPAVAFGSAIAGGAVLGAVGAVLAMPAAAMVAGGRSATGANATR